MTTREVVAGVMNPPSLPHDDIRIWRGNLDEKSATIWMRFFGRGDEMIVAERQ